MRLWYYICSTINFSKNSIIVNIKILFVKVKLIVIIEIIIFFSISFTTRNRNHNWYIMVALRLNFMFENYILKMFILKERIIMILKKININLFTGLHLRKSWVSFFIWKKNE